jgi:hypothetical protein
MSEITNANLYVIIFIALTLLFGLFSVYLWIRIYHEVQRGSKAWLLLALTAIFLIETAIFPYIAILKGTPEALETSLFYSTLFSAVFTALYASAGFILFKAFLTVPKEELGKYLLESLKPPQGEVPEEEQIKPLFTMPTLLQYTKESNYENAVVEMVLRFFVELVNVVLVSTEPRTSQYRRALSDLIDLGAVKFVELSTTTKKVEVTPEGIIRVPLDNAQGFKEATKQLPEGCRIIFEPITPLILQKGAEWTYKYLSEFTEYTSTHNTPLIGMLNSESHDSKTISQISNLFISLGKIEKDRILVQKGDTGEYIRLLTAKQFYFTR